MLGQIVAIWGWLHMKPWPHKSQKGKRKIIFDLSVKLYTILVFAASIFYTVGLWVATPSVSSGIKEWILGMGLGIEVIDVCFYTRRTDDLSSYHWVYGVSHSLHGTDLY